MGIMKLCLVLLLVLVVKQWIPCEASRKMLMEEEVGGGSSHVSRKILSEEGEEANSMETELMLPDETESEKVEVEQEKEPLEELEKKDKEEESTFPESQDEKAAGEKIQKKKKNMEYGDGEKGEGNILMEQERTGQLVGENLQEEEKGERNVKKKVRNDVESLSFPNQTLEEDPEGLSVEAFSSENAEVAEEMRGEVVLSDGGKVEDGTDNSKEKLQAEEQSSDAQKYKEDVKEKPKKGKEEEVEGAAKEMKEKADADEVSESKALDDKSFKGETVLEVTTDKVTPADAREQEMQGGVKDLVTQTVEEKLFEEKEQQTKEEAGITKTKEQESLDKSKQTEGGKAKKKSLKKSKTLKQPKSEGQGLKEKSKAPKFIDDKVGIETKAGEASDLQSKQVETQETAKPKTKKKKKVKSFEKAEKSSEKKETRSDDNKIIEGTKDSDKKVPKSEISNKVDIDAITEEDESKKKPSEEGLKGNEDELPTVEKQEENLKVEVQSIAKDTQERAEDFVKTSSAQGSNEDDDGYDFMQDFSDFSTNFQDTASKVADHLSPNIQKLTDTSKVYFNRANQQIAESFSPVVGKQLAPFFASLVSYGLLLVPLAVVILLFEHIRALLSLQKVLLFVNIYLAAYFATLLLATFVLGEPMNFFYKSSASGYVHLQLLQALGYIVYLILQTFDLVFSLNSETVPIKVTVVLQWLVAFTVGFHYYVTVFHRAMALKGPHTNWKIYGIYSIAFLVLCLFARIKRVKKGYMQLRQADTNKKQ